MSRINEEEYIHNKNWNVVDFSNYTKFECAYFSKLFRNELNKKNITILEIGFGNGNFLGWSEDHLSGKIYGVEKNSLLINLAQKNGFETYEDLTKLSLKAPFDLIVALDVIEHIDKGEIVDFFKSLSEFMDHDSTLYLRFPNGDSPFGRINQNGDLTHTTAIGAGALKMLCKSAGLKVSQLKDEPFPIVNVKIARAIAHVLILISRKIFSILFGAIFFQGNFIPLGPNYIAIIKKDNLK